MRLGGGVTTFPLVMVQGYPFIESSIAGVPGKLMLDTGMQAALFINYNRVPVSGARVIGRGLFGSGETFEVRLAPEIKDVRVGGLSLPLVTSVESQDARLLESITPDFNGWIGYTAFSGHALKLDYSKSSATFYPDEDLNYLENETIVASLSFETRKLPNIPIIPGAIGKMEITTTWDTGLHGALYTTAEGKAKLLSAGHLTPSRTQPENFDLHGLEIGGHSIPTLLAIEVDTAPSPAAGPIGLVEADVLKVGYSLLRNYKTLWDFRRKKIFLLKPSSEG